VDEKIRNVMRHGGKKRKKNLRKYFPEKNISLGLRQFLHFLFLRLTLLPWKRRVRVKRALADTRCGPSPEKSPTEALLQLKQFEQKNP